LPPVNKLIYYVINKSNVQVPSYAICSLLMKTLLISIPEACSRTGIGRSFLYERLATGSIRSVKAGRRRLIDAASLEAWAASLPEEPLTIIGKGHQ
jgi:excisionase family DNA binding protein